MTFRSLITAASALAIVGTLAVPVAASAQSYGHYARDGYGYGNDDRYYDPCERDQRTRGTTGGLVGAAIGAAAGSAIAADGVRTEGGVIGALLGAAIGARVGRDQAACESNYDARAYGYGNSGYYEQRDYGYDRYGYGNSGYGNSGYGNSGYGNSGYGGYGNSGYGNGRPVSEADGCRLTESRIGLPDGREDIRYVRVCPDEYGRYRVVD